MEKNDDQNYRKKRRFNAPNNQNSFGMLIANQMTMRCNKYARFFQLNTHLSEKKENQEHKNKK